MVRKLAVALPQNNADGGSRRAREVLGGAGKVARAPAREAFRIGLPSTTIAAWSRPPPPAARKSAPGAAFDADGVEFAPDECRPVSAMVVSEAMMVVPKNLLAPSSREATFTMSPITV